MRNELRVLKKMERRSKFDTFRGLKRITAATSRQRKALITHLKDKHGQEQTERANIADVFAEFYGQLYAAPGVGKDRNDEKDDEDDNC